jgi:hypothetical protein
VSEESSDMEGRIWLDAMNAEWRPPAENIVLVALPDNLDEGKSTLSWALNNFSGNDSVCFAVAHVYKSTKMIPLSMKLKFEFALVPDFTSRVC